MSDFYNILRCDECDRVSLRKQRLDRDGFVLSNFAGILCQCGSWDPVLVDTVGTLARARSTVRDLNA